MPGLPIGLSVSPAKTTRNPTVIYVRDIGATPLKVDSATLILHRGCQMQTATGVTVTPGSFTLSPGQVVKVSVRVPDGRTDYGILFRGHVPGAHGNVVTGAVGSQVLTGGAASCALPKPPVVLSHAGLSIPLLAGLVLAGLVVVLAVWGFFLRRSHNQR